MYVCIYVYMPIKFNKLKKNKSNLSKNFFEKETFVIISDRSAY